MTEFQANSNIKKKRSKKKKKFGTEYYRIREEIKRIARIQRGLNSTIPNPKAHPTLKYVRYADDWIIGI